MSLDPSLSLLYQALASPIGIVLEVSDYVRASQRLYRARSEAHDPALVQLQFRHSPYDPEHELWIVKAGKVELAKPPQEESPSNGN